MMTNDIEENRSPDFQTSVKHSSALNGYYAEAQKIVESARTEVALIRTEALDALNRERKALEERVLALESARRELEADTSELERRYHEMEGNAFEEARRKGFEKGREEGREQGFSEGEEKAKQELEKRVAEEIALHVDKACAAAAAPLRKLLDEMRGTRQSLLHNWEENILQISAAIAFQTIMREPTLLREAPLDLLREALDLAMNCATLKIRMNPRDVANLREPINSLLEETGNLAKSELIPDSKITVGGCLVETSLGVVDERLEARLERIVDELSE